MVRTSFTRRAVVSGGVLLLSGSLATASAPPRPGPFIPPPIPGVEKAKKDDLPPIPEGVPTTRETVYLPSVNEVRMGREAAKEVEKEYKIVKEGPQYERLQRVAKTVVAAAQSPDLVAYYLKRYNLPKPNDGTKRVPFEFRFTLVQRKDGLKDVNAFSLAGGPIFFTTDLLDYARSDHELAGVLGHEIAHVAYHHVVQLVAKQAKAQKGMLVGALAGLLLGVGGAGAEAMTALYGAQLYSIAKLTGYGRDLEREADRVAMEMLLRTPYSPVGMLTFMKKLARDDARRSTDFGIYQSHPYPAERVTLIEERLKDLRIAFDPAIQRRISNSFVLEVTAVEESGQALGELRLNNRLLFRAAAADDYRTPLERAQAIARVLQESVFQGNATLRDLRLGEDGSSVMARGRLLFRVLPADAKFNGGDARRAAESCLKLIQAEFWKEKLDDLY